MKLLITDLDNTLYDWVTFFASAFSALTKTLAAHLRVSEDSLLDEFRVLHQAYGNSEQPYALLELPTVQTRFVGHSPSQLKMALQPAIDAFNEERRRQLKLYAGVQKTLEWLNRAGIPVVGHTEAIAVNAYYRLRFLGVAQYFKRLYAPEGRIQPHPVPGRAEQLAAPRDFIVMLPANERKPNPRLLLDICASERVTPDRTWYVGDSLTKDVAMANEAGVVSVWARYGTHYERRHWDTLVRVTHWTPDDVSRESEIRKVYANVRPRHAIDDFGEILALAAADAKHGSTDRSGSH